MKRVYVTEGGYFNEYGQFYGTGVIGVDSDPQLAVCFPIRKGYFRHQVNRDSLGFDIVYKSSYSDRGYRITVIDAF